MKSLILAAILGLTLQGCQEKPERILTYYSEARLEDLENPADLTLWTEEQMKGRYVIISISTCCAKKKP